MKKTQMIHSPRTFQIGLGLILAASLAAMPVLTGASDPANHPTKKTTAEASANTASPRTEAVATRRTATATEPEARSKARRVATPG